MGGIEDDFAGLMLLDIQASLLGFPNHINNKMKGLHNYLIAQNHQILFPGRFGMKCSMDIATGAVGVLEILNLLKKYPVD